MRGMTEILTVVTWLVFIPTAVFAQASIAGVVIVDLRPGVYAVTFTLPGFNTVRREGIELAGS
jgi:hypothetical protein